MTDTALGNLEQVLGSGCIELDQVRVVYDDLPGRAICAATIDREGVLWLAVDIDKASANRHALAMIRETLAQTSPECLDKVAAATTRRAPLALVS